MPFFPAFYPDIKTLAHRRARCMKCFHREYSSCYYRVKNGTRASKAACDQIKTCLMEQDNAAVVRNKRR